MLDLNRKSWIYFMALMETSSLPQLTHHYHHLIVLFELLKGL